MGTRIAEWFPKNTFAMIAPLLLRGRLAAVLNPDTGGTGNWARGRKTGARPYAMIGRMPPEPGDIELKPARQGLGTGPRP
jgi:hypothetical protein